mgnify:CR=1 FL=1
MRKCILFILSSLVLTISGCSSPSSNYHKVTKFSDHVYLVDTYKEFDYDFVQDYCYKENYNWQTPASSGGGCSIVMKELEDGTLLAGRNMDLNISHNCAYIVRSDVGGIRTFGLQYTFRDMSPTLADIQKNGGISDEWYKLLPFMCDDIINERGLYVEVNMRNGEYYPTGEDKFACSGTNPLSSTTIYMFTLARYIAQNCSRVSEVEAYVNSLNIYSKEHYWNYAFMVADKTGDYGLIEMACNKVYFHHYQNCQTNFYVEPTLNTMELVPAGIGRYQYLRSHVDEVETSKDMYELMKQVSYSQVYWPYLCPFDVRSENIGAVPYAVYQFMMDDEYKEFIYEQLDESAKKTRNLSRDDKRNLNSIWESTFTEVVDVTNGTISVRFYEDDNNLAFIDRNRERVLNAF